MILMKIVINPAGQDFKGEFVVFDLETTGFSALVDRVIENRCGKD